MLSTFFCWVCDVVGMIIAFLPSTPPQYTIGGLITATGNALPMIGTGLLSEIYTMVQGILALFLVIKAFKIFQYFKVW